MSDTGPTTGLTSRLRSGATTLTAPLWPTLPKNDACTTGDCGGMVSRLSDSGTVTLPLTSLTVDGVTSHHGLPSDSTKASETVPEKSETVAPPVVCLR